MSYINCFVPTCNNSKSGTPDKEFFHVNDSLKMKWCRELNIKYEPKHHYYCCEDHLNLQEDLENYYYWKLMHGRPILKPSASLKLNTNEPLQNLENLAEPLDHSELKKLLTKTETIPPKKHTKGECLPSSSGPIFSHDIGVQCKLKPPKPPTAEKSTNYIARKPYPKTMVVPKSTNMEISDTATSESPSLFSSCTSEETDSTSGDIGKNTKNLQLRQSFLKLIYNNPKRYIGVPKKFWWILKYICDQNNDKITELNLIVTLFKIKQNDSMIRISEQFQISTSALTGIFAKGIECLANFFQNLIYLPSPNQIKKQLPTVFKIRFSNVQCILDCFEIEIEKPSDPLRQAQTWSQYKGCNTLKYLIGCTPNGFVVFISKGYGGRISDKAILERSNLIDILPFNAVVLADRGFKEVETHLMTKGVKLLRPPSVYSSTKPTKEQVILTKVIASLRVHVERVIRRLREFRFLKPHSVVQYSHIGLMDEILKIACGLVNLQDTIIKNT